MHAQPLLTWPATMDSKPSRGRSHIFERKLLLVDFKESGEWIFFQKDSEVLWVFLGVHWSFTWNFLWVCCVESSSLSKKEIISCRKKGQVWIDFLSVKIMKKETSKPETSLINTEKKSSEIKVIQNRLILYHLARNHINKNNDSKIKFRKDTIQNRSERIWTPLSGGSRRYCTVCAL